MRVKLLSVLLLWSAALLSVASAGDPIPIAPVSTTAPATGTPAPTTAPAAPTVVQVPANQAAITQHNRDSALAAYDKPAGSSSSYFGNVNVGRILQAKEIISGNMLTVNLTVQGNIDCNGVISTPIIRTKSLASEFIVTGALASPTGTIIVNGDLLLTNTRASLTAASFLAEDVVIGGVKQWKLVRHDDFQQGAEGWSLLETSSCSSRDRFLGGHCKIANGRVSKVFDKLPAHKQVRVTGRYHMIDNWQGETAFLQLDNHYVWSHRSERGVTGGIEMCGNEQFPESKMSLPVDVVLAHSASFLEVSFGSRGGDAAQDACDRSFGVDDVMVYVR